MDNLVKNAMYPLPISIDLNKFTNKDLYLASEIRWLCGKSAKPLAERSHMNDIKCPKCNEVFKVDQAGYADILKQVRDEEFAREIKKELGQAEILKNNEIQIAQAANALEIERLQSALRENDKDKELAVIKAVTEVELQKNNEIKIKDEELAYYKDFKLKLSTKMVGESLEEHCEIEFNKIRATGFPRAYFEKDNKVVDRSKGDYIFKDFNEDGVEFVSIMFEMKNESDDTENKKKNTDFLKELDKDRNAKGCEYAILVTVLEAENELYNTGIVDVSHLYPKMYVVRPNFFIPILTLLRNAAQSTAISKSELARMREENIDITNFESELLNFQTAFARNYDLASGKFEKAIKAIDKSIEQLQKTKDELLGAENNLRLAKEKAEDVSVKKLTRRNPTMATKFKALPPLNPATLDNYEDAPDEQE